jgi:hypothetical protein
MVPIRVQLLLRLLVLVIYVVPAHPLCIRERCGDCCPATRYEKIIANNVPVRLRGCEAGCTCSTRSISLPNVDVLEHCAPGMTLRVRGTR